MLTHKLRCAKRGGMAWGVAAALLAAVPAQANDIGLGLTAMPSLRVESSELLLRVVGPSAAPCVEPGLAAPQRVGPAWQTAWLSSCDSGPMPASSWMAYASAAADLMPMLHAEPDADDARPELAGGALALVALATLLRLGARRPSA